MKNENLSTAQLLTNSLTFWLGHIAIGAVSWQAVFAHLALLIRVCEDEGPFYARKYILHLRLDILTGIRSGKKVSIDGCISEMNLDVARIVRLELDSKPAPAQASDAPAETVANPRGKGRGKQKGCKRGEFGGSGGGGGGKQGGGKNANGRRPICFASDPANNLYCSVKNCDKEHIDTSNAANASRFNKAKESYARRQRERKGNGKG